MHRVAQITLVLAIAACGGDPDPALHQAVLDRLDRIDARLQRLEARAATTPSAGPSSAPPNGVPGIALAPYNEKIPRRIRLQVRNEGVGLDHEVLSDDVLARRLAAALKRHGDPTVLLHADPEVDHARIVAVMDLVRRAGIRRMAMATASEDGETTTPR